MNKGILNLTIDNVSVYFQTFLKDLVKQKNKHKITYIFILLTESELGTFLEFFKEKSKGALKVKFSGKTAFIQRISESGCMLSHLAFNNWKDNEYIVQNILQHFNCSL